MVQKLIIFGALITVATAVLVPAPAYPAYSAPHYSSYAAPAVAKIVSPLYPSVANIATPVVTKVAASPEPYDPNPQYSFSYDVHDHTTGDIKSQQETRNGDVVQGAYSFIEADGTRRLVEYTADPVQGFNAVVHREPAAVKTISPIGKVIAPPSYLHVAPAPVVAKLPVVSAYSHYDVPAIAKLPAYPAYPTAYHG